MRSTLINIKQSMARWAKRTPTVAATTSKTTNATKGKRKGKNADADEPPTKFSRQESTNTQLRRAIGQIKQTEATAKSRTYKPDASLLAIYPKAVIHEDYSCVLNQTNIGQNNNKFYGIQLGKINGKLFTCFTRWGRVGEQGMNSNEVFETADQAIQTFKKKFQSKTQNNWDKRDNFVVKAGKYTLLELDEDDEDSIDDEVNNSVNSPMKKSKNCALPSLLDKRTRLLIKLIFNEDMFLNQMNRMNLDIKKMPLGKLSKLQIAKGLEALLDIEQAIINKSSNSKLQELSSRFYTLVPHSCGRMTLPVINSQDVLQQKKDVMMTLSDIELTQSIQKDASNQPTINPLDEKFEALKCNLELVTKNGDEFKMIEQFAAAGADARKCELIDVWKVNRDGEDDRFGKHKNIKERKLLWHGTNVAVVAAILKAGLRIMPHSGGRVGSGIYFASEHGKSAGYVMYNFGDFEGEKNVGFMFLTEVALGKQKFIKQDDHTLKKAPPGFDSVVARGHTEPDSKKEKKLQVDGHEVIVPLGKPVKQKEFSDSHFTQSEYLVYQESQAHIRYLLKFSFDH